MVELRSPSKTELVERVKAILASKSLSLNQVSQGATRLYGRSSPYFLPHNWYYDLGLRTFSPSLHQLFALSRVSGFGFNDWLRVFGFFQKTSHDCRFFSRRNAQRSSMAHSMILNPGFPGFKTGPEIFRFGQSRRLESFCPSQHRDAFAHYSMRSRPTSGTRKSDARTLWRFPIYSRVIVRADIRAAAAMLPTRNDKSQDPLFLIEHANGFCCCRLQALGGDRFLPLSAQLPYAQVELQLHEEVRVLGLLDLEIRPLLKAELSQVPKEFAQHWRPSRLAPRETRLSHLLRDARARMGLSFREASATSRHIAVELGDKHYFAAAGSLSDYEAADTPPRHIHKAITLCVVYGIQFSPFLASVGLDLDEAGKDPIPDNLVPRTIPSAFTTLAMIRPQGTDSCSDC